MTNPWYQRHARLFAILAAALLVRVAAAYWWQARLGDSRFAFGDSETYWTLAQSLAHGDAYQYGSLNGKVFRMPGYPLFLAAVMRAAGDSVLAARVAGAMLGAAAVAAVYWLAHVLFDRRTALAAATAAAFYPGAIGMSVFILSEALFCPLMLAELALVAVSWRASTGARSAAAAIGSGVLAGLATLARPGWLLFVPFAAVCGLAISRERPRIARLSALGLLGLLVTMAPWWVRNWTAVGRFVPTTLQAGASLYDGLNPAADGSSNMAFVPMFERAVAAEMNARGSDEPFEVALDRRLGNEAVGFVRQNMRRACELALLKFVRMWNIWPNAAEYRGWPIRLAVAATYGPILVLGLVGAWRFALRGWPWLVCALPAVYLGLLHMVFVSSIRYREPAMLAWTVLAAAAVFYKAHSIDDSVKGLTRRE